MHLPTPLRTPSTCTSLIGTPVHNAHYPPSRALRERAVQQQRAARDRQPRRAPLAAATT
ncbi:hypothetical protein RR48_14593 [Papilio machaon]|uniref:Uncharacterized protein n=1 Tax=Papilio machaon TaxID=76193 RepID=A0A194QRI8_PAPMA|nr:hypothetical protein RR48_14593 [Papilio machaon]